MATTNYWSGYKLHLDVADGQIPISAVLTSAHVHASQVAIPLSTMAPFSVGLARLPIIPCTSAHKLCFR